MSHLFKIKERCISPFLRSWKSIFPLFSLPKKSIPPLKPTRVPNKFWSFPTLRLVYKLPPFYQEKFSEKRPPQTLKRFYSVFRVSTPVFIEIYENHPPCLQIRKFGDTPVILGTLHPFIWHQKVSTIKLHQVSDLSYQLRKACTSDENDELLF